MQSIQRVASLWVSSPLKPCRWTPFPFAPQAGYAKLGGLFRAAHVTLGDHVDFVDRLGVVPDTVGSSVFLAVRGLHARAFGVEDFLAGAGKRDTGGRPWQRDDAQIFSFGAENLNAGIARGDVETALGVDGHAVAVAAAFE